MVFCFASNRPNDKDISPVPFRYLGVLGARLEKTDWTASGRSSATSRRTITASVNRSGRARMVDNRIYRDPGLKL